ncbi:MAG: hypothetical protein RI909_1518 [Bacteroidota bacterium]
MKKAYLILALFAIWCLASALWYMFSVKGIDAAVNPQDSLVAIIEILGMTLVSVLLGFGIAWYMREDLLQLRQQDVHALLNERTNLLKELQAQQDRAGKAEHTLARARETFHDDYVHISRERDQLKENQQKAHQQLSNLTDEFNLLQIELGNGKQKITELTNNLAAQQVSQKEKETSGVRYFINPFNIAATIEKSDIDDLKKIKGIGPVIEKKLNMLGIVSFKQISELSDEALDQVAHTLKFFPERIKRDNWVQQAKELTKGKSK